MIREEYGTDGNVYEMSISNGKEYTSEPNYNEWCTDCKEYNHEKHCCPRWNKVIRTTLNDSINFVLDKIREEIEDTRDGWIKGQDPEWHSYNRCLQIIDKYKAESEKV